MNEKKRIRGSNFTPEEELELVQNIVNYQHIIELKELSASTRNEKDAAWSQIAQIFNSKCAPRTVHQLRSKYDNMKTLAKRLLIEKQNNIKINSFSSTNNIRSNIAMNIISSIINKKSDISINSIVHCNPEDLHLSEESSNHSDNSIQPISLVTSDTIKDFEIQVKTEITSEDNILCNKESLYNEPVCLSKSNNTLFINTPAEINKNLERSKNLVLPTILSHPASPNINNEDKSYDSSSKTNTVRKKSNPRLQELLRVKTEYLKRKMILLEREDEERIKRMKHEEELHKMKMKIMILDITIKEEELQNLRKTNL